MFTNKPLIAFDHKKGQSPLLKAAELTAAGAGFVAGHRLLMRKSPDFAKKAYSFFTQLEERSPFRIFRTFGLSELYSSYLPSTLEITHRDLFLGTQRTRMGEHMQRMLGGVDLGSLVSESSPMKFTRSSGSAFMQLEGREDLQIRFFKAEEHLGKLSPGRIVSSSQRLKAPLESTPFDWSDLGSMRRRFVPKQGIKDIGYVGWGKKLLHNVYKAQQPSPIYTDLLEGGFQPGAIRVAGKPLQNLASATERTGFLLGERIQNLLADIRVGLWKGSYNTLAHTPLIGSKNKGLINELLSKRVLPIYLGALGLGYADYLTNHIASDTAIDIYQKARVFHAKLTDNIPGARKVTDKYEQIVPGSQYGPLALPTLGLTVGALVHYSQVVSGKLLDPKIRSASTRILAKAGDDTFLSIFNKRSPLAKGLVVGLAAMIPFLPGMLGSRKDARELQDIYSGRDLVPIRSGRWWDLGTTPWEGNRIKEYRPHWSVLHRSRAEKISLYGSEKEYWAHNPILHPLRWLKDPYWLENKQYKDRPYPITSPAFTNVPLVGPLLAATIGKLIKPPVRMHPEWSGTEYDIGSSRLQPRGSQALAPAKPKQEFSLADSAKREAMQFSELIGLPGFIARTLYSNVLPNKDIGKDVYFQGSRSMESVSRRYYEKELGAGIGPNFDLTNTLGYTEPLRRFIQPEPQRVTVNQIPNKMPSWLPGEDYFLNFKVGDPYAKISEGYARLPGTGYEALHPEIAGLDPEDYPDIVKMSILGDVAPYSVQYRKAESSVRYSSIDDIETRIEYQKIAARVKAMKDSVVRTDDRVFSREVIKSTGTISGISSVGIQLEEYPGRVFNLSSVGYSAADQSAVVLGEYNNWSKAQVAEEVERRQIRLYDFLNESLSSGTKVSITTPIGALQSNERVSAVFDVGKTNINKSLITEGLGRYRKDLGGPEAQSMFGPSERLFGYIAENASFTGDEARWNPLRYIPSPYHTKLWQERTPLSQYEQQEVEGSRLRRWQHPIEDFIMPYVRGAYKRVIGDPGIPNLTQKKWDLNTTADMLEYIRDMKIAATDPSLHGRYTSQASRTAVGANLFGEPTFIASTFSGRDATYFNRFLKESDPSERNKILSTVPHEMARALSTRWVANEVSIATAEGKSVPAIGSGGRLYTEQGLQDYDKADTKLNYGDYERSKEIAEFFAARDLNLPDDVNSPLYNPDIDYEDVKLKIIQQEGYDAHDFGLFDDRAALLWRKPYVDGAIRELTGGDHKSVEQIRKSVEDVIVAANDKNPQVIITSSQAKRSRGNVRVDVDIDQQKQLLQNIRRNPDQYQ